MHILNEDTFINAAFPQNCIKPDNYLSRFKSLINGICDKKFESNRKVWLEVCVTFNHLVTPYCLFGKNIESILRILLLIRFVLNRAIITGCGAIFEALLQWGLPIDQSNIPALNI